MRAWRRHAAALPGQSLSVGSAVLAMPTDDLTPMARHLGGGQALHPEPQAEPCPRHVSAFRPGATH
jgi:hypothetical protein